MYINIKDILYYLEMFYSSKCYLFNTYDYKIYDKNDILIMRNLDCYNDKDFILLPYIGTKELKKRFINSLNDNKTTNIFKYKQYEDNEFENKFHLLITDNNLYDKWDTFEKKELEKLGIAWCEENNINYTVK